MTYGFADFLYLLFFGWLLVLILHLVFGGVLAIFYQAVGKKHVIAASFKEAL